MTIIAAYKQGNAVSILSDFRASFPTGNREDAILKYFQVDDRMGFFTAGSVPVWTDAAQTIHNVAKDITVDNIVSTDGPLNIALRTLMEQTPAPWNGPAPKIMGLGVYWTPTKTMYFEIQGKLGSGIMLLPLEEGITVLGSGQLIPGIKDQLTKTVYNNIQRNQEYLLAEAANAMRDSLKSIMNRCGSSAYQKLGISPVFAIAGMNETGFRMEGEEFMNHSSGSHGHGSYHYSFERVNGQVLLANHQSKEIVPLTDVSTFSSDGQSTLEFDPENRTLGFDPSSFISGNGIIYVLVQNVGTTKVHRIVYKTRSVELPNGKVIADPRYIKLCDHVQDKSTAEVSSFLHSDYGEYGLLIPPDKQASFEAGVASHVLDHIWMSHHVDNYESILSCNE